MELLVCMLLASLITGIRPISDMIQALKGVEPPHLAKARLRAERQAAKAADARAKREARQVRPGEGKPTLRDVARVYWGDALQDVIDSHDRRRAERKAQQQENETAKAENRPAQQVRPSLVDRAKRVGRLLWDGPEPKAPVDDRLVEKVDEALTHDEEATHGWRCDQCGIGSAGYDSQAEADADGQVHDQKVHAREGTAGQTVVHDDSEYKAAANHCWECRKCGRVGLDYPTRADAQQSYEQHLCAPARPVDSENRERLHKAAGQPARCDTCGTTDTMQGSMFRCLYCVALERRPGDPKPASSQAQPQTPEQINWTCQHCGARATRWFDTQADSNADYYANHMPCPVAGELDPDSGGLVFFRCGSCGYDTGHIYPDLATARAGNADHQCTRTDDEGENMTTTAQTGGSATGDAHDLESASNECDLLDGDLTAIDTALDLIDERITSAGAAAERLKAFLDSKNMPDGITAGMATALDMLSPESIKSLMDAIAAAKAGVVGSKEAIDTMNDQATEALQGADGSAVNGR